jgi:uncharacterized protein (TIGR02246 family)
MTLARRCCAWLPLLVCSAVLLPNVAAGQGVERPHVPIRRAMDEIRVLRQEYAEAFNKQATATLVAMYAPDATLIRGDGEMLTGKDAIQKSFEAGPWGKLSIESDTVRVFGNTAVDVGTARTARKEGGEDVGRYLVVLRRGVTTWKISSLASVPVSGKASATDSTQH